MEQSDELLMQGVSSGDLKLLSGLYERYKVMIYNYFLKMTYDRELSNDLVQNVFIRIIKYKSSYNPDYSFKSWIFRIAKNTMNDHFNSATKKNEFVDVSQLEGFFHDGESNEQIAREKNLYAALSQLEPDKRELIVWSKLQGMKYEEIAGIKETSVGAIKVQIHRTMSELRKIYFSHEN